HPVPWSRMLPFPGHSRLASLQCTRRRSPDHMSLLFALIGCQCRPRRMHALLASRAEFLPIWCATTPGQQPLKLLLSFPVDLRSYEQPEIGHDEERSLHRRRTPLGGGKRQKPGSGAQKIGGGSLSTEHKA